MFKPVTPLPVHIPNISKYRPSSCTVNENANRLGVVAGPLKTIRHKKTGVFKSVEKAAVDEEIIIEWKRAVAIDLNRKRKYESALQRIQEQIFAAPKRKTAGSCCQEYAVKYKIFIIE